MNIGKREMAVSNNLRVFLQHLDWDKVVSGITDSRYTVLPERHHVQVGARIMYDRICEILSTSVENEMPPKPVIKCPKCGYKGKPNIKYENGYHKWYCPKCGEYQK